MKKFQIILLAVVAVFSFSTVKAQTSVAKDGATKALTAYYGIKNALIAGNASAANTAAKELLTALNTVPADQLQGTDKATWTKYADKLQFDARHISESSDIAHLREHFSNLSQNMYSLVKELKFNTAAVYRAYCPMKKYYWLSEESAIKNPYYGNQMLGCGEVKETIEATSK